MTVLDCVECPTWALGYLINNDPEGLSPEEIVMVDDWAEGLGLYQHFSVGDNEEPYFSKSPAFGLPSECVLMEVIG